MPTTILADNPHESEIKLSAEKLKFIDALKALPDPRDPRGKRHSLIFLIVTFVFATLVGRSKVSSIHRYMTNKIDWLREVTGIENATPISRAHLPRMLANLDWHDLGNIINDCFGDQTTQAIEQEWIAIDGKVMRGTLKSGEKQAMIHAVAHDSRIDVAQARQAGDKSSEIPVLREFIKEEKLESNKISMDAHHCNPETLAQINQAKGFYLVQVKENQPKLLEQCRILAEHSAIAETVENEAGHGRVSTREGKLHDLSSINIDTRWEKSGLQSLIVMTRESFEKASKIETKDTSYYLSNYQEDDTQKVVDTLTSTIRKHWGVESNNWQLDVTFGEDRILVKEANQAQIMGKLRCFAMTLLRLSKNKVKNFQARIEKFMDSPDTLIDELKQANFL